MVCLCWHRLLALGLKYHLSPKYHDDKYKRTQHQMLMEALTETTKTTLVAKTLRQAWNRVRNIKSRLRITPNNPVLVR